jgi:hypothetical protein
MSLVTHPSRPIDRPPAAKRDLAMRPLVHFQQAMPEHGPAACQERIGLHLPEGFVTRRETSD